MLLRPPLMPVCIPGLNCTFKERWGRRPILARGERHHSYSRDRESTSKGCRSVTGRAGPPGDRTVRPYPPGQQSGRYPVQAGYGQQPDPYGRPPAAQNRSPQPGGRGRPPGSRPPGRNRLIDYPRHDRQGFTRWIPSWRLVLGLVSTTALCAVIGVLVAYATTTVPPVTNPLADAQTTVVYYADGKTELTRFEAQNRTDVPLATVPLKVRWAVISAEDRTFYDNKGVSPIGIVRAAWNNTRGGALQGGSTITQQYVKNTRTDGSRTWQRKIKEFFVSIKIANDVPKDRILGDYLNTIYFGRNSYGIQAAAHAYFHKDITRLTVPEGAYLAGIINGPELYDPWNGTQADPRSKARAVQRYDYVLDGMALLGKISPQDAQTYKAHFPVIVKQVRPKTKEDDQTPYLTQMVRSELQADGYPLSEVAKKGYRIVTTFDKKMIDEAVASVHEALGPRKTWTKGAQVGLVTLDPSTGAVRAIYGGDGVTRFQNAATQDAPQAGSTFKAFTLLAALEGPSKDGSDGLSLNSRFSGRSPYRYQNGPNAGKKVSNFANEQFGMVNLTTATEHSVNTVFAALNDKIGEGTGTRTRDAAERAGIPKEVFARDGGGAEVSNVLGNATPHVIDMASAYGTIAAQGKYVKPYVISVIKNKDGGVVEAYKPVPTRVFDERVTADATYALHQVIEGGTGNYAQRLDRPAAGKTGTVGSGVGDDTNAAWFVGFTPQLSTAVAIHALGKNDMPAPVVGWGPFRHEAMQGGMFPVRVWTDFMRSALDGKDVMRLPDRAYVGETFNRAPVVTDTTTPSPTDTTGSPTGGQGGQPTDPNQTGQPGPSPTGQPGGGPGGTPSTGAPSDTGQPTPTQ
jgi:membrane peptidoglycan carboxypeptidase